MLSDYVELAHGRSLFATILVQPLPANRPRQNCTILAAIALERRVPVLVAHSWPGLVNPDALGLHVIYAQPDLLVGPDALVHVVVQLVVVIEGERGAQRATLGNAVLAGSVVMLL